MNIKDLKNKNFAELQELLKAQREQLRLFRFSVAGSKTKNVHEGRDIRKTIARILTLIGQNQNNGNAN